MLFYLPLGHLLMLHPFEKILKAISPLRLPATADDQKRYVQNRK